MTDELDYCRYLPESLHKEAEELIRFLTFFPYEKPVDCPYCGSRSFHLNMQAKIDNFRCNRCKKGFNQLTGTSLANFQYIDLWPKFAMLRLSGLTYRGIRDKLNISLHGIFFRDNALNTLIKEEFPGLAKWWQPLMERESDSLKPEVEQELNQFIQLLDDLINKPKKHCPKCHAEHSICRAKEDRPSFRCRKCDYRFSSLKGTPLHNIKHMSIWVPFVERLVRGDSDSDMNRTFGLCLRASSNWRKNFISMMEQHGYHQLAEWLLWQRQRRRFQTIKLAKNNYQFSEITRSRLVNRKNK